MLSILALLPVATALAPTGPALRLRQANLPESPCKAICIESMSTLGEYQNNCAAYDLDTTVEDNIKACSNLMCTKKFLDGFDECVACMVTTGETSTEQASWYTKEYTEIRGFCIDDGFDVGATSTADSSNDKAGTNSGYASVFGSTTVEDLNPTSLIASLTRNATPTNTGSASAAPTTTKTTTTPSSATSSASATRSALGDNNAAGKLGVPFGAVLGAAAVFIL